VLDLGVVPCGPAIRQAFEEGLVDSYEISLQDVEKALNRKQPLDLRQSKNDRYAYLEDCVAEISWWASFQPKPAAPKRKEARKASRPEYVADTGRVSSPKQPYLREGKKIGRNETCPCGSGQKYKKCCGRG